MTFITDISVNDIEKRRFPDKHYEYVIRVKWSDDVVNVVYRRYSQFYLLHSQLIDLFPVQGGVYRQCDRTLPFLPGKILFGRSHIRKVALDRLQPISDYCKGLLKLPTTISRCSLVLQFFQTSSIDLLPRESLKQFKRASKKSIKSISQPIEFEQYEVLLDYRKEEQSELSIRAGSTVEVIEKQETGWWFVKTEENEGEGWVPSSYLQKVGSTCDDENVVPLNASEGWKYLCTRSYTPQEPDEIQLDKGCPVEVLEKNLDGWWLVKYKGRSGIAPAIYLSRTDTLKAHRVRDNQLATDDTISDDFNNSGSSFDDFSSSDNSSMENLHLSWEVLNENPAQSRVMRQAAYKDNVQEKPSRKPLRPPPPDFGGRRNTPPQLPLPHQITTPPAAQDVTGRIAMFNKDMLLAFKAPSQQPAVKGNEKLYPNSLQQNHPASSSVAMATSPNRENVAANAFRLPSQQPAVMSINKPYQNPPQQNHPVISALEKVEAKAFRLPNQQPTVKGNEKPYQNFPQQNHPVASAVAVPMSPNREKVAPNAFRLPSQQTAVKSNEKPYQNFCVSSAADTKPKVYPSVQTRPKVFNRKNQGNNNGMITKLPSSVMAEHIGNQGPGGSSTKLPEFYNVRLKPVNGSSGGSQSQSPNHINNAKPAVPPKPKPS